MRVLARTLTQHPPRTPHPKPQHNHPTHPNPLTQPQIFDGWGSYPEHLQHCPVFQVCVRAVLGAEAGGVGARARGCLCGVLLRAHAPPPPRAKQKLTPTSHHHHDTNNRASTAPRAASLRSSSCTRRRRSRCGTAALGGARSTSSRSLARASPSRCPTAAPSAPSRRCSRSRRTWRCCSR